MTTFKAFKVLDLILLLTRPKLICIFSVKASLGPNTACSVLASGIPLVISALVSKAKISLPLITIVKPFVI